MIIDREFTIKAHTYPLLLAIWCCLTIIISLLLILLLLLLLFSLLLLVIITIIVCMMIGCWTHLSCKSTRIHQSANSRGSHHIAVERHGQGPTGGFCPHRGRIGTHKACPAASWCRQLEVAGFPSMELPLIAGWFFGNGKIPWMTGGTPIWGKPQSFKNYK